MWTSVKDGMPIKKGMYIVYRSQWGYKSRVVLSNFNGKGFAVSGVELWAYSPGLSGDRREVVFSGVGHLTSLENAGFSTRVWNAIFYYIQRKSGIGYHKVLKMTMLEASKIVDIDGISSYRNIGEKSILELKQTFEKAGLFLTKK